MSKKQKKNLRRILISIVCFLLIFITDIILENVGKGGLAYVIPGSFGWLLSFGLYFLLYLYIGHDILKKAIKNIGRGQFLDENFLMVVATIGAFSLGIYDAFNHIEIEGFDEGCAVLIFYQLGEWFQNYAVGKSRKNISELMDIRPDYANIKREDGSIDMVDPSEVKLGDIIVCKPGERIPLDGEIISGSTTIDTKALTGESVPVDASVDDKVISGTVNLTGLIEVRVLKEFYDSTVSKILELVENASNKKSKSENFITKFARVYTPIIVISAIILCISLGFVVGWQESIYRSLTFLVVSCPCALVISIPLSFFAGIGGASRNGILVKGSAYLEKYNKVNIFVFDKTGTLTKGNFAVVEVDSENKEELLYYASIAEKNSNHPIALSIKNAYGKEIKDDYTLTDISGKGIKAIGSHEILCGNEKLMNDYNIEYKSCDTVGTIIHVAVDNKYLGHIVIADEIKSDAKEMITYLNSIGARTIMLTGDNERIASHIAKELGIKEYKSSLLPQNKVEEVDKLLENKGNDLLCFVGDGINDAPVLMKSDIGISMGNVGSDAAIEASDIVLMHDDLKSISISKKIAKKTMRIVIENIVFALGIKLLILICSAFGWFNLPIEEYSMWIAVFGDVGVAVICILNAMRCNKKIN